LFDDVAAPGIANVRRELDRASPTPCDPRSRNLLIAAFVDARRGQGVRVETSVFGACMEVELVNDGPVPRSSWGQRCITSFGIAKSSNPPRER
jgi:hypothetical protein